MVGCGLYVKNVEKRKKMDKYDTVIQDLFKKQKEYVDLREEYNLKIIEFIKDKIIQYPSLRFYQLLEILGLTEPNKFYEESVETYKKLIDQV